MRLRANISLIEFIQSWKIMIINQRFLYLLIPKYCNLKAKIKHRYYDI